MLLPSLYILCLHLRTHEHEITGGNYTNALNTYLCMAGMNYCIAAKLVDETALCLAKTTDPIIVDTISIFWRISRDCAGDLFRHPEYVGGGIGPPKMHNREGNRVVLTREFMDKHFVGFVEKGGVAEAVSARTLSGIIAKAAANPGKNIYDGIDVEDEMDGFISPFVGEDDATVSAWNARCADELTISNADYQSMDQYDRRNIVSALRNAMAILSKEWVKERA